MPITACLVEWCQSRRQDCKNIFRLAVFFSECVIINAFEYNPLGIDNVAAST